MLCGRCVCPFLCRTPMMADTDVIAAYFLYIFLPHGAGQRRAADNTTQPITGTPSPITLTPQLITLVSSTRSQFGHASVTGGVWTEGSVPARANRSPTRAQVSKTCSSLCKIFISFICALVNALSKLTKLCGWSSQGASGAKTCVSGGDYQSMSQHFSTRRVGILLAPSSRHMEAHTFMSPPPPMPEELIHSRWALRLWFS